MFDIKITLPKDSRHWTKLQSLFHSDVLAIKGISCQSNLDLFFCHLTVSDARQAIDVLQDHDIPVEECRPVLVIGISEIMHRLGEIIERISDAGMDIEFFYLSEEKQLILGIDDISRGMHAYLTHLIRGKKN